LAVFDCDGTLVDGQADVCWAMERAFTRAGLPAPDNHAIRRSVGLSLPAAVRSLAPDLTDDQNRTVTEFYRSSFRARREEGLLDEPLYDGIADLLRGLHGAGWQLAVATGKSDRGLAACLASHGIADLFVSLQTADRHPSKPHPAMLEAAMFEAGAQAHEAVMIGDTSFDMVMARSIGVAAIGAVVVTTHCSVECG
jgi:phosphoglycolate phosphatase